MTIKSLEEIKSILKKFKNAGGVGFAIQPQLLKIANQVGLMGYDEALARWMTSDIGLEKVVEGKDFNQASENLYIGYEGLPIRRIGGKIIVGIKRTIEDIETAIKED